MTRIAALGSKLEHLPDILERYENELDGAELQIKLEGKKLEHANVENASWQVFYDQRRIELKTVVDYLDARVQKIRGRLFRSYTESHQRELSDRAKDKYIDNEQAFLDMYELYLEAKELYNKYQAVVDAFTTRGYALNNITKIRVASLEDVEL